MFVGIDKNYAQNSVPKYPQKETSFLPFPKTGNNILHGQSFRGVRPSVMILEIMVINYREKYRDNTQNCHSMRIEGISRKVFPRFLLGQINGLYGFEIAKSSHHRCHKRQDDEQMTNISNGCMKHFFVRD